MLNIGRRARFEKSVNAHFNDLYRFAFWLCRNRWHAEDLVQETLLRAWRNWAHLREERAAKAWLFTILRREFLRVGVRATRFEPLTDEHEPAFHSDLASCVDLDRALRELPEASSEALLMQVLGGFSCAEISEILGASEGAIMTRLTRARQALRHRLGPADTNAENQA